MISKKLLSLTVDEYNNDIEKLEPSYNKCLNNKRRNVENKDYIQ